MSHSYKFYENKDCKYFPCHEMGGSGGFNCLFCFCPLYFLGKACGGKFEAVGENGSIKDCSSCIFPHLPENYELIMKKISENIKQL